MRMLAWVNLLSPDGYGTRFLSWTHISGLLLNLHVINDPTTT